MVMRMIEPVPENAMFEFVKLFNPANIYSLDFGMYNGTETRAIELPGDVTRIQSSFHLYGKSLESMMNALKLVDYNQIQSVNVVIQEPNDGAFSCYISSLDREIRIGRSDNIDIIKLKNFCKANHIEKLTLKF